MKLSNHTIIVENYPSSEEHLLYSTRTQALVKINQELKHIIQNYVDMRSFITDEQQKNLGILHQMGLIVHDENEDNEKLKAFLQQLKHSVKKSIFSVTILTTYACNFKCVYCFEESSRTHEKMDFETAEHVMNWLKRKIVDFGYEELFLVFYGGEPLLNKPALEKIAQDMQAWCATQEVRFRFMLQTNGYLLTPEIVDQYLTLGLDQVRISLDGIEEHDVNRPLRGGGKTFQKVVDNIVACCDKVKIGISTSYSDTRIDHIERLLEYLKVRGILYKLGRFIFAPIHATLGAKGESEKIRGSSCMAGYENDALVKTAKKIELLMQTYRLANKNGMAISICPVTRDQAGGTIDQHGNIYKCPTMLGHPEFSTGNVKTQERNQKHYEFLNLDVFKQCPQDCTFMPMCSGGCRLASFLKHRNFKVASCYKPYLYQMAPDYIKKEYQVLIGQKKTSPQLIQKC